LHRALRLQYWSLSFQYNGENVPWGCHRESGDYGLHVLVDKDPEGEGIVDVVAVHGLDGHYRNTWTMEDTTKRYRRVNWLETVLPKQELIHARILAFSYNSSVQFSKSTSDVFVFADQLLEHLMGKREHEGEQCRPIVFICHSLGGIVVKQVSYFYLDIHWIKEYVVLRCPWMMHRDLIEQPKISDTRTRS
jgi:protein SERAC1